MPKAPKPLRPVPDWFYRELKAIDPQAEVRWCERQQRWQIMRPRRIGEVPSGLVRKDVTEREWWQYVCVFRVENSDGSYRELDRRLIDAMRMSDHEKRDWREVLQEIEKHEAEQERDRNRPLNDARREMAKGFADVTFGSIKAGYGGTYVQQARSHRAEDRHDLHEVSAQGTQR